MEATTLNTGNVAFMVITTVLVFLMTPGLALFYGGLVPRKSALTMMFYSLISISIVTVLWVIGGFSLVFGDDIGGVIGSPLSYAMLRGVDLTTNPHYGSSIPFLMFCLYQLMFAIITAPLLTGAIAERITLKGWMLFLVLWNLLIYFPVAHWVWGGGFLQQLGFVDYAGGTVIHATAGFSALVGVWYLGRRRAMPKREYGSMNLVLLGTTLLLVGWFGFNAGGALVGGKLAAIAMANTAIASALSTLVWLLLAHRKGKPLSLVGWATGAIAGLATITPCAGYVTPQASLLIGVLAAFVCYACSSFAQARGWDDALGVWGVHGMGGVAGTLFVGLFARLSVNGIWAGVPQFQHQLVGVTVVVLYASGVSLLLYWVCDKVGWLRVADTIQRKGLDSSFIAEKED